MEVWFIGNKKCLLKDNPVSDIHQCIITNLPLIENPTISSDYWNSSGFCKFLNYIHINI